MPYLRRYVAMLLIAILMISSLPVAAAQTAGLVTTQSALQADTVSSDRERINDVLARADVQDQLLAQGVSVDQVQDRVAALSNAEVSQMADQLDAMPAGAGGVIGALFAVFVILLVTDILGLTNVFPFTR
ncbi:PA2779 family protein [Vreelandella subglaciescola]|jgi:hypothetical protein|uniref:PA2779 family protein n=1 Tax=Vreelandella subglaciescola TaxID=29571 RepID=A0A1M7EA22_9GAMM|nr:PA2779 family protein [Halomonas subglaciescola]SHL88612.1 hypothetical protein SAMN05878437_0078 [Halomonas subglaciescola]